MRSLVAFLTLSLPIVVVGQEVKRLRLPKAESRWDVQLQWLAAIRELRDGRVLISDPRGEGIVVFDFKTGKHSPVGRKGRGPGEYTYSPLSFPALGGDSTIVQDVFGTNNWLILDGARVAGTLTPETPIVAISMGNFVLRWGMPGRALAVADVPYKNGTYELGRKDSPDSLTVISMSITTSRVDTLAKLRHIPCRYSVTLNEKGEATSTNYAPARFGTPELAQPYSDGWLAVARLDPYRVDWRSPDGRWTLGKPLPFEEIVIDEREEEAYAERRERESGTPRKGAKAQVPARPSRGPRLERATAKVFPPFLEQESLFAAPDGRLLVRRVQTADHPENRYDVINRKGELEGQIILEDGETILGMGRKWLYVVEVDEDGIQWLRRHAWRPTR
jgi:hypothetical protein